MAHSTLDRICAKLLRAEEHVGQLELEVDALIDAAPYRTVLNTELTDVDEFRRMLAAVEVPSRISIIAEEAIHQTRNALDHLASALVLINGTNTSKTTQFRIFVYRPSDEKEAARYAHQVAGMSFSAKAIIDG